MRVEIPNPVFARMLQQAIGVVEGEIRVMLQYLFQSFGARGPVKYRDTLLETSTEEIGYIQMLTTAVALNMEAGRTTTNRGVTRESGWRAPVRGLISQAGDLTIVRYARRYLNAHQGGDLAAGIAFHALLYSFPLLGAILALLGALLRNDRLLLAIGMRIVRLFPGTWEEPLSALLAARDHAGWIGIASLLGLFWLGSSLLASLVRAFERLGLILPVPTALSALLTLALSLLTEFALFLLQYWHLPHMRQGFRDVWRGAVLAAALLVAATQLFPLYAQLVPTGQYGTLLGFSLLLATWLYLLAHIALIGAAVNAYRCARWLLRPVARHAGTPSCERPRGEGNGDGAK